MFTLKGHALIKICMLGYLGVSLPLYAAQPKLGLVDMQRIILTVDEGKSARALLEQKIKTKESELQTKKQELDKMNEDWKQQSALLSEEAKNKKQQEFQQKVMDLRNAEMEFQNHIKKEENQATQAIAGKVAKIVEGFAKQQSLDVVFEANSAGLIYMRDPIDLTDQVIVDYNKAHPEAKKIADIKK